MGSDQGFVARQAATLPASAALKPTTLSADRAERDQADHQDFVRPCDGPHSRVPFYCPAGTTFRFKFPEPVSFKPADILAASNTDSVWISPYTL